MGQQAASPWRPLRGETRGLVLTPKNDKVLDAEAGAHFEYPFPRVVRCFDSWRYLIWLTDV